MPYNFQGRGGIVNTGPVYGIYYLDTATFTQSLIPDTDHAAATKFYVDQGRLRVEDSEISQPHLAQASLPTGRIVITVSDRTGGGRNIIFTLDTDSVTEAEIVNGAVTAAKIANGAIDTSKLSSGITLNAISALNATTANIDMRGNRIEGLAAPSTGTDAANRTYVDTAINNLVDGAPAALDTLRELAEALDTDSDFATTITNLIIGRTTVDSDSITRNAGVITVATGGIDTDRIATNAVTADKIGNAAVDIPEIATTNSPTVNKILHTVADTDGLGGIHLEWVTAGAASVTNNSIGPVQVNADLAGAGLTKDNTSAPIRVDTDFGLEFTADTDNGRLRVDTDVIATRTYAQSLQADTMYDAGYGIILDTDSDNIFRVDTDEIANRQYVADAIPDVFGDTEKGLVPNPNATERNARHYLRADGQWGTETFTGSAHHSTVTIRETTSAGGSRARVQLNFSKPAGTGNTAAGLTFTFTYPDGSTRTDTLPNNVFYQNIPNANQLVLRMQTNYEFDSIEGIGNIDYDAFSAAPTITFDFLDVGNVGATPVSISGNTNFVVTNTIVSQGTPDVDSEITNVTIQLDTDSDDGLVTRRYVDGQDNALGTRIDSEAVVRATNDTALGNRIDSEATRLDNEVTNRENADNALGLRIDSEAIRIDADILNRENADTALGLRIDSEALRIDGEITNRQAGDTALGDRIDSEAIALRAYVDTHAGVVDTELSAGRGITVEATANKHSINVDTDDTLTFNAQDQVGVADNSLRAVKLNIDTDNPGTTQQYALEVTPSGTKSFEPVTVASSLGELTDVTTSNDTERDLLSYNNGMWRNSQVLGFITENDTEYLSSLFGNPLVNRIPILRFQLDASFVYSPSDTVNMDTTLNSITVRNTNNPRFTQEYIDRISNVNIAGTDRTYVNDSDSELQNLFSRDLTTTSFFQDTRTGAYINTDHTQNVVVTFETNIGTFYTATGRYTWRQAPNPNITISFGNALNFDAYYTSYEINSNYYFPGTTTPALNSNGTIQAHTFTPNSGFGDSETVNFFTNFTDTLNISSNTNIYWNTSVSGSYSGTLLRPSSVYLNPPSVADRTIPRQGSYPTDRVGGTSPTRRDKFWYLTLDHDFTVADLGTLSQTGYSVAQRGFGSNPATGRTQYGDGDTDVNLYIISIDQVTAVYERTNPIASFAIDVTSEVTQLPDVQLGHAGAQVTFRVYRVPLLDDSGNWYQVNQQPS